LFVAGTLSATGALDVHLLVGLLIAAAIIGDTVNYTIGRKLGLKLFANPNSKIFRHEYLVKTHAFYERHGGKTIILARFVPIVRTFAPFVAGAGEMSYGRFLFFNVVGAVAWVGSFTYLGFFFGNLPVIKSNLSLLIVGIIFVSILPGLVEFVRQKRKARVAA
jgi:membrane-associated protein